MLLELTAGSAVGGLFGQVATGLAHQRGPLSLRRMIGGMKAMRELTYLGAA
jgi:hypothetical protein